MSLVNKNTLVLLIVLFITIGKAINVTQTFTSEQGGTLWSNYISVQPQQGIPSQYFMCGIAFREMSWVITLWNCNCGQRFYRWKRSWRCNWCDNTFWTASNGLKVTFCSAADWNNQKEIPFQTGNTASGKWRPFKCPSGQMVSRVKARLGTQTEYETPIGWNGISMQCQNVNFTQNTTVTDDYGFSLSQQSKNNKSNLVSGLQVKYDKNGKMTGVKFGFQPVPLISKVQIIYSNVTDKIDPTTITIDTAQVDNTDALSVQKTITFPKTYVAKNTWLNDQPSVNGYLVSNVVKVDPLSLPETIHEATLYTQKSDNFAFGNQLARTYSSTQKLVFLVPSCRSVIVKSVVLQQKVNVPYEATITFIDRTTGALLGTKVVKGVWKGVMNSPVKTQNSDQKIEGCTGDVATTKNLTVDTTKK